MKILFISDIHGVTTNLKFIENKITELKIDKLVVLGDLYYMGFNHVINNFNNKEVKEFLIKYKDMLFCMRGNCDSDVDIVTSDFPICEGISSIYVDGIDIYITHGNLYSYNKSNKLPSKGVLVYGHEHIPSIKYKDDMVYINTGSISIPREDSNCSYCLYENNKFTLYDIYENVIDVVICN